MNNEEYYRMITYPNVVQSRYFITNYGKIVDAFSQKIKSYYEDKDGYFRVSLKTNNGFKNFSIHRLVAWEYCLNNRDINLVVDHIDGNKQNNNYNNLEWVTVKENTIRAQNLGLRKVSGEDNPTHKYTTELIHKICNLIMDGKSNIEIVKEITKTTSINISEFTIEEKRLYNLSAKIRNKECWPDIVSQYDFSKAKPITAKQITRVNEKSRFTEEQIHKICQERCNYKKNWEILKILGITEYNTDHKEYIRYRNALSSIVTGRSFQYISSQYDMPLKLTNDYDHLNEKIFNLSLNGLTPIQIYRNILNNNSISRYYNYSLYQAITVRCRKFKNVMNIPQNEDVLLNEII